MVDRILLLGVVASSSSRYGSMASFRLARDSSIVFPWLAMSRSGHQATYRSFLLLWRVMFRMFVDFGSLFGMFLGGFGFS